MKPTHVGTYVISATHNAFGRSAVNVRSTRSRAGRAPSRTVVVTNLRRLTPANGLDVTNIGAGLEQLCGKGMPQRMQANPLGDARGCGRLVEEAAQLPRRKMLPLPTPGE